MGTLDDLYRNLSSTSVAGELGQQDRTTLLRIAGTALTLLAQVEAGESEVPGGNDEKENLPESRVKARAVYDWAMANVPGARQMTIDELYDKLIEEYPAVKRALPPKKDSFARYLRDAGVSRRLLHCHEDARSVVRLDEIEATRKK